MSSLPVEGHLPSFDGATGWLNSEPLSTESLRGKVVLVDFWTYTCINWLRTLSYIRAWAETYEDAGLVVIGVHTPEFPFEQDVDNVREAAKEMEVEYPVALDSDYAVWRAFDNSYWPAAYIADAQGRIRHHRFGEGGYEELERVIQRLLGVGSATSSRSLRTVSRLRPTGPTWSRPRRTSATSKPRTSRLRAAPRSDEATQLCRAGPVEAQPLVARGRLDARERGERVEPGRWPDLVPLPRPRRPSRHGTAGTRHDRCRSACSSTESAPGSAHGLDVDEDGHGAVAQQRLHQLVRQQGAISDRTFEITFLAPGVEAYVFTFG